MISIRSAKASDSEEITSLIKTILEEEFSGNGLFVGYDDLVDVTTSYGGARDLFLIAEKDGEIIGTIAIKEDSEDAALLRRIFVRGDQRGKGYGDSLLSEAMDFCEKAGYRTVSFRGIDRMKTAMRLCLKRGFEEDEVACLGDVNMVILHRVLD